MMTVGGNKPIAFDTVTVVDIKTLFVICFRGLLEQNLIISSGVHSVKITLTA